MRRTINLKKGLNLNIEGSLSDATVKATVMPDRISIIPDDFPGFLPKPAVKEGDTVSIGSPLLHDKSDPAIMLVSPIGGIVESIDRGARRKIERVTVKAVNPDAQSGVKFTIANAGDPDEVRRALKASGLWAMMRKRPYDIIPADSDRPRDIFVTALDTAPLALDIESMVLDRTAELAKGVEALSLLTKGTIYICVGKGSKLPDIKGAETVELTRIHPAGNTGVQIANIKPVNKGETVWTLDAVTLARIGHLMLTGTIDTTVKVALTGSELVSPHVVETVPGAPLAELLKGAVRDDSIHHRVISGNVLTGDNEGIDGYLRYPYRQVTVIPEGDDKVEFMGWASMDPAKMSESRSFLGHFLRRKFNPDARINGGRRAMIMSGVYDRYIPMDILPEPLLKAIIARDIDQMEALGIYEVAPEDFALAEYADPSKIELQRIVRDGLDYMRREV